MGKASRGNIISFRLKKNYCILVPSLVPTGPIRGAIAFANAIASIRSVKLISLKNAEAWTPNIDKRVEVICLAKNNPGWLQKKKEYCKILSSIGERKEVISYSMCFSADFFNLFCRKYAVIFSSIRANMLVNYRMEYGLIGILLAYFHLLFLRGFDFVSVMSLAMAKQVSPFFSKSPIVVGNFIDEDLLEIYRKTYTSNKRFKFIFVGSLTERKQPLLIVEAIKSLHLEGYSVHLEIIGSGPLERKICEKISKYNLSPFITLHGQVNSPYTLLSEADAFVLPSISEGISRAALEALHLGIPCILRNVDGNNELIVNGLNGELFEENEELISSMKKLILESKRGNQTLLPKGFRQKTETKKILVHVEDNDVQFTC